MRTLEKIVCLNFVRVGLKVFYHVEFFQIVKMSIGLH